MKIQPTKAEQAVQDADAKNITEAREADNLQADENKAISARRESELNRIAGDLPNDSAALWMYAEHSLTQSAVSMIDAGRAFIKLKELLPHGEFLAGIEERGISPRSTQQICAGARAFADRSEKFLKLGRTKLYACLEFSNEELDALEDGKSILDHDLDDLDRMTTRELKALIKKRGSDLDVKDQLLEAKNKQIDDVATENAGLRGETKQGDINPTIQAIESEKGQTLIPLMQLKNRALKMEADAESGKEPLRDEYFALQSAINDARDEVAQAMDALYNCGGNYQASIAQAGMPADEAS